MARFTNGKKYGSRITDIKNLFSRITRTSQQDTVFNNLLYTGKNVSKKSRKAQSRLHIANRMSKLHSIDDSNS